MLDRSDFDQIQRCALPLATLPSDLDLYRLIRTAEDTELPVFAVSSDSGITETVLIKSYADFIAKFGPFKATETLHVAVRSFFDNGDTFCYLVPTTQLVTESLVLEDATLLVAVGQDILEAVSQLCMPDACLFAVLDGPQENISKENFAHYPSTSHAAVYYPWLSADWAETAIPRSAAMAGLYCKVNREKGVWSSTAHKLLEGGVHSIDSITADQQAQYKSINMIREISGTKMFSRCSQEFWIQTRKSSVIFISAVLSILFNGKSSHYSPHRYFYQTQKALGQVFDLLSRIISIRSGNRTVCSVIRRSKVISSKSGEVLLRPLKKLIRRT